MYFVQGGGVPRWCHGDPPRSLLCCESTQQIGLRGSSWWWHSSESIREHNRSSSPYQKCWCVHANKRPNRVDADVGEETTVPCPTSTEHFLETGFHHNKGLPQSRTEITLWKNYFFSILKLIGCGNWYGKLWLSEPTAPSTSTETKLASAFHRLKANYACQRSRDA